MSVETETVKRVARLACIKIDDDAAARMTGELNTILVFVEKLNEVDVSRVEPMTAVVAQPIKMRADVVTNGGIAEKVVANAPASEDNLFVVPKVIE